MTSKSFKIARIGCKRGPARLGKRDNEGIDGGPFACEPAQMRCSSCKRLRHLLDNVARLEQAIRERITPRVPL